MSGAENPVKPFLTVVSGNPTDEEVAALVAVLATASSASAGDGDPALRDHWGSPVDRLRPQWGGPGSFTNLRY
ncbi:acyl-CoA carboxylase subunit epsilon [Gordonia sp. DT30]|uniref:acyl-CoA carboxylase subunit epsilon n=1 Tax=unclassified Gordonia (in: high G+C Gram-positive bacteria) TaxID=2657482 RepID=UPI003CE6DA6D